MASDRFQPLQGMSDIAAPDVFLWQALEQKARDVLHLYGYREIRTPILERTPLFVRSMGEATDVVQKEMYRFEDRGGRDIALRPEGTAGAMRYAAGLGQNAADARLYYLGPMFRCERPQAGRKRQFHQLGTEALGAPLPAADAECIAMQVHILAAWGLGGGIVKINTRGTPEDQVAVASGLREALRPVEEKLCDDCRRRKDQNVLRVLDCKHPACRNLVTALPPVTAFMSQDSRDYLDEVMRFLKRLDIAVVHDASLVRGIDYYVHTVWEITHSGLGAQDALSGGGRYRIQLEGATVEGVGFAMGLERVLAVLQAHGQTGETAASRLFVWIVTQHPSAYEENLLLAQTLRLRGFACGMDLAGRSLKAQMRAANRAGVAWVIVRGEAEMAKGTFALKDMATGLQEEVEMPELMERLSVRSSRSDEA